MIVIALSVAFLVIVCAMFARRWPRIAERSPIAAGLFAGALVCLVVGELSLVMFTLGTFTDPDARELAGLTAITGFFVAGIAAVTGLIRYGQDRKG